MGEQPRAEGLSFGAKTGSALCGYEATPALVGTFRTQKDTKSHPQHLAAFRYSPDTRGQQEIAANLCPFLIQGRLGHVLQ